MTTPSTTPTSVEALLAEKIQAAVEDWCIDRVPADDESRADVVIIGKPTRELRNDIVISVHMQHPFGPVMDRDTNVTGLGGALSGRSRTWPVETLGGMRTEEIIGCVQVRIRERKSQDEAAPLIAPVIERVRQAINRDSRLAPFEDEMGNFMSLVETFRAVGYESGGGDVSINFRWVDFRAYVHSTNCRES